MEKFKKGAAVRLASALLNADTDEKDSDIVTKKSRLIDRIPDKYKDTTFHFFACCLLGATAYFLGNYTGSVTGGIVNRSILAIIFGILANAIGIIEKNPLEKSGEKTHELCRDIIENAL